MHNKADRCIQDAAKWRALCGLLDVPQDTPPNDIFSTVQELRWLLPAAATA